MRKRKQGITLKGMEFKYRTQSGNPVLYVIGDMFGIPKMGNCHYLFRNGVNLGMFTVSELCTKFKIDITDPRINAINRPPKRSDGVTETP
jgi:hypothetical protein